MLRMPAFGCDCAGNHCPGMSKESCAGGITPDNPFASAQHQVPSQWQTFPQQAAPQQDAWVQGQLQQPHGQMQQPHASGQPSWQQPSQGTRVQGHSQQQLQWGYQQPGQPQQQQPWLGQGQLQAQQQPQWQQPGVAQAVSQHPWGQQRYLDQQQQGQLQQGHNFKQPHWQQQQPPQQPQFQQQQQQQQGAALQPHGSNLQLPGPQHAQQGSIAGQNWQQPSGQLQTSSSGVPIGQLQATVSGVPLEHRTTRAIRTTSFRQVVRSASEGDAMVLQTDPATALQVTSLSALFCITPPPPASRLTALPPLSTSFPVANSLQLHSESAAFFLANLS